MDRNDPLQTHRAPQEMDDGRDALAALVRLLAVQAARERRFSADDVNHPER